MSSNDDFFTSARKQLEEKFGQNYETESQCEERLRKEKREGERKAKQEYIEKRNVIYIANIGYVKNLNDQLKTLESTLDRRKVIALLAQTNNINHPLEEKFDIIYPSLGGYPYSRKNYGRIIGDNTIDILELHRCQHMKHEETIHVYDELLETMVRVVSRWVFDPDFRIGAEPECAELFCRCAAFWYSCYYHITENGNKESLIWGKISEKLNIGRDFEDRVKKAFLSGGGGVIDARTLKEARLILMGNGFLSYKDRTADSEIFYYTLAKNEQSTSKSPFRPFNKFFRAIITATLRFHRFHAITMLKKENPQGAIRCDWSFSDAHYAEAQQRLSKGNKVIAIEHLKVCIELNPHDEKARSLLYQLSDN
jgi:hypothetical protein